MTERQYEGGSEPTDAEVDAIFAALVAGLTVDAGEAPAARSADDRSLEVRPDPVVERGPVTPPAPPVPPSGPDGWDEPRSEVAERYRPELAPLGRPPWPILIGWAAMTVSVLATLLAIFGVPLPQWTGWVAVAAFLGGFGLLVSQLPRHRPPDAGDGAVL